VLEQYNTVEALVKTLAEQLEEALQEAAADDRVQCEAAVLLCVLQAEVFAVGAARSERVVTTAHDHTCR